MIALAIATGIPPAVWIEEGDRAIVTAYELLDVQHRASRSSDVPPMSG